MPPIHDHEAPTGAHGEAPHGDRAADATGYAPGTGRRLQFFAAAVALALLAGFFIVHRNRSAEENGLAKSTAASAATAPLVDVVTVADAKSTRPLTLPGETAAWYESTIYARVSGYVGTWSVDIGDKVKKGQVLATIETPELDAQLVAARAKLRSADALVKVRQAEAAFAQSTYDRWRDSPKGVVSDQERDAKKAAYESGAAQLAAAQAEVNLDQAEVDRITALEQFKQVTAPFDGTIVERRIDIGNLVTADSTANTTPLYRMTQNSPIRVFVDVPQAAAGEMKVGTAVQISSNDLAGRTFEGTITRTARAIDVRARTLHVEVDLPNKDDSLVPGLYVQAGFHLPATGLVQVPAAAMVFRSSGPQVAVVGHDGKVSFRHVEIARDDGNVVELGSGVTAGERVVLNVSSQIADGEKVAVDGEGDGVASAASTTR
jgi:RND family efflux transporter MFP subunit